MCGRCPACIARLLLTMPRAGKLTNQDKSAYHSLNKSYEALAKSPTAVVSPSALGPLSESASRKKLITLVTALNNSFPSNDFWCASHAPSPPQHR